MIALIIRLFKKLKLNINLHNKASYDFKRFKLIPKEKRQIVFYAETRADWTFIGPVYDYLKKKNQDVVRITSDISDLSLKETNVFYIGNGNIRTIFFRTLNSKCLALTLTDLDTLYLKKSMYPVHYFYIFHSLISTHRSYREHAFNGYSTIFCAGSYHVNEIRKTEEIYNLNKKKLEYCGYPRLDQLISEFNIYSSKKLNNKINKILIAPSWGPSSLTITQIEDIVKNLLDNNFEVIVRLHPMTLNNDKNIKKKLLEKFNTKEKFYFDEKIDSMESFIISDFLISDWSGSSIEFAFTKLRPVFFIDTEPKKRNNNWSKLNIKCIEEEIRKDIGYIIPPNKLNTISNLINDSIDDLNLWKVKISKTREQNIFNLNLSIKFAAEKIYNQIKS